MQKITSTNFNLLQENLKVSKHSDNISRINLNYFREYFRKKKTLITKQITQLFVENNFRQKTMTKVFQVKRNKIDC